MRQSAEHWRCISCGKNRIGIICEDCAKTEKHKQRQEQGSLTTRQFDYIEHLTKRMSETEVLELISQFVDDYNGHLETLSTTQSIFVITTLKE